LGAELRTLAGKTVSGDLVSISDESIVLRTDAGEVSTPVAEVLSVDFQNTTQPAAKYSDVELTDGSLLHCSRFTLKGKEVELTLVPGKQTIKVPLDLISYVVHDANEEKVRQEWQGFLAGRGTTDLLFIKDANGAINRLEGTVGDGDEKGETIEFQRGPGQRFRPPLARVHGIIFSRKPDQNAPPLVCKVHDAHRNLLMASKLSLGASGFTVTTVAGAKLEYPKQMVAKFDYSKGKLTYLSDLLPVDVKESSSLGRVDHFRRDKNLDDGPIRVGGQGFAKGLALHSRTELVFDLDGQYNEFKAFVGVDDLVGGDSNAILTIEGDGRPLFREKVTRKDKPRWVTLNITKVKLLRIIVGSEDFLDLGDHLDLADAKVSK
jgi:hypothetical protein